jgi:hypothetical protein
MNNMSTTTLTTKPPAAIAPVAISNIGDLVANTVQPYLDKRMVHAKGMLKMASAMTIMNSDDLAYVLEQVKEKTRARNEIEALRTTYSVPLNAALKSVNAPCKAVIDVYDKAIAIDRAAAEAFVLAEQRAREQEEAARARLARIEAARLEAETVAAERTAAAQRAEAAHLEAERVTQAEAEQRRAAELVEKATTDAETALAAGDTSGAAVAAQVAADAIQAETDAKAAVQVVRGQAVAAVDAINEAAALAIITTAPAATSQRAAPVAGVSWKKEYEHEVLDIVALCAFVVANPTCAQAVIPNEAWLKKHIAKFGMNAELPGVTVRERMAMKVRA